MYMLVYTNDVGEQFLIFGQAFCEAHFVAWQSRGEGLTGSYTCGLGVKRKYSQCNHPSSYLGWGLRAYSCMKFFVSATNDFGLV